MLKRCVRESFSARRRAALEGILLGQLALYTTCIRKVFLTLRKVYVKFVHCKHFICFTST